MKSIFEKERFRKWFNLQFVKLRQIAMVGSLVLLAVNLSFSIYPYVEHRFPEQMFGLPRTWIGVPLIFVCVMLLLWLLAHVWTAYLEMYRTQQRARRMLNPYNVYHFNPFQIAWFRNIYLPIMKNQLQRMEEGEEKQEYRKQVEKVEEWLELGFIPKDDYPEDLQEYYLTDKQNRL